MVGSDPKRPGVSGGGFLEAPEGFQDVAAANVVMANAGDRGEVVTL